MASWHVAVVVGGGGGNSYHMPPQSYVALSLNCTRVLTALLLPCSIRDNAKSYVRTYVYMYVCIVCIVCT